MKGPWTHGVTRRLSTPHLENHFGLGDELIVASHHATNEFTQEVFNELQMQGRHAVYEIRAS